VDKRGRPVTISSTENYKKYYELTSSDEDDSEEEAEVSEKTPKSKEVCDNNTV
jgi:chromosome segregation and condensation protein ScpB